MFYFLFENYLHLFNFLNIFQYITFRSLMGGAFSFVFILTIGKSFIQFLLKIKSRENINKYLDNEHKNKKGTPNMGGVLIAFTVMLSIILFGNLDNFKILILIFSFLAFFISGFLDDYYKIKNGKGFNIKTKLVIQVLISISAIYFIKKYTGPFQYLDSLFNIEYVILPFTKEIFNIGILYYFLMVLIILGSANAVNFTDGLDGLATGNLIISFTTLTILTYIAGNFLYSSYLYIPFINDVGEISVFVSCLIGSLLGFLWFNSNPAQIFMGDAGSIPLGGTLGIIAILIKQEFLLIIIGGVFVVEAFSVILQILSFKLFKKRIFLIAPIHHHFERQGIAESKIVIRFWIIGVLFSLIAIATIKIR